MNSLLFEPPATLHTYLNCTRRCELRKLQRSLKLWKRHLIWILCNWRSSNLSPRDFLLVVNNNVGRISHGFGVWSKSRLWNIPPSHLTPSLEVTLANMLINLVLLKTRYIVLSARKDTIIRSFVLTLYQPVPDGQTDRALLRCNEVIIIILTAANWNRWIKE